MPFDNMIHFEADFVSRSITKRLSMEFDWKRKPKDPRDREVVFNGTSYRHLSFETEPLADLDEFTAIRDAWDIYDATPRHTLKTKEDLRDFQNYQLTKQRGNVDISRYVAKKDGPMKRLRRDLARAFKHQQAGFDVVTEQVGRISHQQFCEALNACGIPCTVDDLDNAKRQNFKSHQSFYLPETIEALKKLKTNYFAALEIDMFLQAAAVR